MLFSPTLIPIRPAPHRQAYRKAALKWHPDKCDQTAEGRAEAERMFKLVGEAHAVLGDAGRRAQYDSGLSLEEMDAQGGPGGAGGGGHSHGGGGFGGGHHGGFGHGHGGGGGGDPFGGFGGFGGFPGFTDEVMEEMLRQQQQQRGGRRR